MASDLAQDAPEDKDVAAVPEKVDGEGAAKTVGMGAQDAGPLPTGALSIFE